MTTNPLYKEFEAIKAYADKLRSSALVSTSPEEGKSETEALKQILKDVSVLQQAVGTALREVKAHTGSLRKASPKTKPTEGEVRNILGTSRVFISGVWYPLSEEEPTKE